MSNLTLPEAFKIVQGHEPALGDAIDNTSDIVSCKNVKKLWAVLMAYTAGGDTDLVVTWNESTDVAGGTTAPITVAGPIWYNIDTATADLMTRATDGYTFTVDAELTKNQIWIVEWDPANFSAGYDCFQIRCSGGNVANYASILYFMDYRYKSDVPVSAITD